MSQFCEYRNGETRISAIIGIGGNLPGADGASALVTCNRALAMLNLLPGLRVAGVSHWYETDPMPPSGQPPYINAVAELLVDPGIGPEDLLARLHEIEAGYGRERGIVNAARTLDLDIIAMGDLVRDSPDPILPHPRAHLRAFVLTPLADLLPDWVHPVLGRTAASLLADLPDQGIRRLDASSG